MINVNFAMCPSVRLSSMSSSRRAALLSRAALDYKMLVDTRTLVPDPQPSDQLPHTRIFNCCRVPAPECDVQARYSPSDTIIVICRDAFWTLENTQSSSVDELETAFASVWTEAEKLSLDLGPGILTFEHRDKWADARQRLMSLGNEAVLEAIQKSAFVVCLDESAPLNADEVFDLTLMGDAACCSNRWFDKPLQFIVFRNGEAALNGEHSPVDGEPVARMMDYILDAQASLERAPSVVEKRPVIRISRLHWVLDVHVRQMMRQALVFAVAQISNLGSKQVIFDGYGKDEIRAFKTSPDAWAQAAIQLAYFRSHGRFAPTYESASTRRHLAGRTETGS